MRADPARRRRRGRQEGRHRRRRRRLRPQLPGAQGPRLQGHRRVREAQAEAMRRSRDVKDAAARSAPRTSPSPLVPTTITVTAKSGREGTPLRLGHHRGDRRCGRGPDGHRARPSQAPPRRAHQVARHAHGARQAARRRRVPDHRRGRVELRVTRRSPQAESVLWRPSRMPCTAVWRRGTACRATVSRDLSTICPQICVPRT